MQSSFKMSSFRSKDHRQKMKRTAILATIVALILTWMQVIESVQETFLAEMASKIADTSFMPAEQGIGNLVYMPYDDSIEKNGDNNNENILDQGLDFIPSENTRQALRGVVSRNVSKSKALFHLIHTTNEEDFGRMQKRCLESVFYHHPNAKTILHVKNMTAAPVQYLIDAGYNLAVKRYDPVSSLKRLQKKEILPAALIRRFIKKVDGFSTDPEGNWYSNESNLLRMILMYLDGGIYLDTDTIVVKPMDTLPPNVIGFQNKLQTSLNGAVLKFEPGHAYMKACLEEFLTHFKNRLWGANGPRLLTRVYFSNPTKWKNLKPVDPYYFQYFSYNDIKKDCYEDLRDYKLTQRMNGIREIAYAVHTNNHVGGTIMDGSVCDCLQNTFCLTKECKKMDHCKPLIEMPQNRPILTGVDYLDKLQTTNNMLSLPLDEYYAPTNANASAASSLKIYVYSQMTNHSRTNRLSSTDSALMSLFTTFKGRTDDPDEADLFLVPSSYMEIIGDAPSCSNGTAVVQNDCISASLLKYYNGRAAKHVFLLPNYLPDSSIIHVLEKSLTISEFSSKPSNQSVGIRVPTFNPHPALQPSAIASRPREWWTKPRKYAFTAQDLSVDKFDLSLLSHAFVKHVQGRKSVGNRPFALLEPKEVDNSEVLTFLQDSTFCPVFFDDDDSSAHRLFEAILSGCIPMIMQYENESAYTRKNFLPFLSRTNYSEFVLQVNASQIYSGSVVQVMKDAVKDKYNLERRQEKLRSFALSFSYGLGPDAHKHDDAFQHILGSLHDYFANVSPKPV